MARRSDTGKGGPPIAGGVGGDDRRASGAVTEAKDRVHPRVFRSDGSIRRIGYRFVYEVLHTWLRPGLAYAVSARLIGGSVDSPISFGIGAERVRIPMTATIRPWASGVDPRFKLSCGWPDPLGVVSGRRTVLPNLPGPSPALIGRAYRSRSPLPAALARRETFVAQFDRVNLSGRLPCGCQSFCFS